MNINYVTYWLLIFFLLSRDLDSHVPLVFEVKPHIHTYHLSTMRSPCVSSVQRALMYMNGYT